ncbi:hypothetical protein D3C81_1498110 [compost metagenome]
MIRTNKLGVGRGRLLRGHISNDCSRPILLKKSAMVFSAEKYAREIEIFTLSRGVGAQISRNDVHKRRFQRSAGGQSGKTDFFNRIDPKRPPASPDRHVG